MSFRSVSPHVRDFFRFRWRMLLLFAAAVFFAGVSGVYFVRYLAKPNTGLVVNFPEAVETRFSLWTARPCGRSVT
jgi:hypothetical protein